MYETYIFDCKKIFALSDGALTAAAAQNAEELGISGDALAAFIARALIEDENFFSLAAECGRGHGTAAKVAERDVAAVRAFYLEKKNLPLVSRYTAGRESRSLAAERVKRLACAISKSDSAEGLTADLIAEYERGGAGEIGMYAAFTYADGRLVPERDFAPKTLSDLVGYDEQKRALVANTEALIKGLRANNVLLYGDAGTGKSTSVKALSPYFGGEKLKIVELRRKDLGRVSELFEALKGRAAKFILFLDDLSFEADEVEYKQFKALIDGGLGARPDNVLLYATSNRAHLVRESLSDRDGQSIDIHRADTVEEKLSLSSRFGLTIFYPSPAQAEYLEIVHGLARRHGIDMPEKELDMLALRWATAGHKRSGRTAEQFIRSLILGYTE